MYLENIYEIIPIHLKKNTFTKTDLHDTDTGHRTIFHKCKHLRNSNRRFTVTQSLDNMCFSFVCHREAGECFLFYFLQNELSLSLSQPSHTATLNVRVLEFVYGFSIVVLCRVTFRLSTIKLMQSNVKLWNSVKMWQLSMRYFIFTFPNYYFAIVIDCLSNWMIDLLCDFIFFNVFILNLVA